MASARGHDKHNVDNPVSWLAKISHLKYEATQNRAARNHDFLEQQIRLSRRNFEFALRSLYEFQEEDYWHDMKVTNIDVRLFIGGTFVSIRGLDFEKLFELMYSLYNVLENGDEEAATKFMRILNTHENYEKGELVLEEGKKAAIHLTYTLENHNHDKNVEARIDDDYLAIADDFVSAQRLITMDDIEEIENSTEGPEARHFEKLERGRHRLFKEYEDDEFTMQDDIEHELEHNLRVERELANLESVSHKHATHNTHKKGKGLIERHLTYARRLKILLQTIPFTTK